MLNKIVLLNCANYEKAVIELDADSIQIVGRNNGGKTTLISVLNFLYVPNQKEWNFAHPPKETLNFYFKQLDKSYLLFEIYKNGYFCILLRRDENGLAYYKIELAYSEVEPMLFREKDGKTTLLDFASVQSSLVGKIERLSDKDYRALLFGETVKDKSVLWLEKEIRQSTFSRIYRYLLNPRSITNDAFKASLLASDGKEKSGVKFALANSEKIESMQRQIKEIERLKVSGRKFNEFEEKFNDYKIKHKHFHKLLCNFLYLFNENIGQIKKLHNEKLLEIEKIKKDQIDPLERRRDGIIGKDGSLNTEIKMRNDAFNQKSSEIDFIKKLDPVELLEAQEQNLQAEVEQLVYSLSVIKNEQHTIDSVEKKINNLKREIDTLERDIRNFENLLIHHLCANQEDSKILNSVLSDAVLKLDKSALIQEIASANSTVLSIFDGKVDINQVMARDPISIESLKKQQEAKKRELSTLESIKQNIVKQQELQATKLIKEKELDLVRKNIDRRRSLSDEEEKLLEISEEIKKIENDLSSLEKEKEEVENALKKSQEQQTAIEDSQTKLEQREQKLKDWHGRLEEVFHEQDAHPLAPEEEKNISNVYEAIRTLKKELAKLKEDESRSFNELKHALQKEHASEEDFIVEVSEDLASLQDKEATIDALVEGITNEISKPTANLLQDLEHFEASVSKLNRQFKKYKISNLKTIEIKIQKNKQILSDLNAIAKIDKTNLFNVGIHSSQMETLKSYVRNERSVPLSDLFEVVFVVDGRERDLKQQIESNGTDIMIKTALFMAMVGNTIIQDEKNKLVIYLDELSSVDDENVKGFIERCLENNFLPVFASPDKKTHIQKYYDLQHLPGDRIIVDKKRAIYVKDRV